MFSGIKDAVVTMGKTAVLAAIDHAPQIMFVGGVVAFGATVYMAVKAAPKVKETIENHNKKAEEYDKKYEEAKKSPETKEKYTKEDHDKDIRSLYGDTTLTVVKHLGRVTAMGIVSIALFGGAMYIPLRQFGELSAEYIALDKTFSSYRKEVIKDGGRNKDLQYMHKSTGVSEEPVMSDDGETEVVPTGQPTANVIPTDYFWIFSAETSPFYSSVDIVNQNFLKNDKPNVLKRRLKQMHVLTRNDILRELGLFDEIRKHPTIGTKFGRKWHEDGDNDFSFEINAIYVPDYTKKNGYITKYEIRYDEEAL